MDLRLRFSLGSLWNTLQSLMGLKNVGGLGRCWCAVRLGRLGSPIVAGLLGGLCWVQESGFQSFWV